MDERRWASDDVLITYAHLDNLRGYLIREIVALREMAEWCCEQAWEGYDIDGGEFQAKAEELGLIVKVPASTQVRDEYDMDWMYDMAWSKLGRESQQENGV